MITRATTRRAVRVETNLPETSAACAIFYSKCIALKYLTLKNEGQCYGVQHSNGLIRWQISTSISHICAFFASSHRFRHIHISESANLKILVKVTIYNLRSGTNRWQISDLLSVHNSNVYSLAIYEIFANK